MRELGVHRRGSTSLVDLPSARGPRSSRTVQHPPCSGARPLLHPCEQWAVFHEVGCSPPPVRSWWPSIAPSSSPLLVQFPQVMSSLPVNARPLLCEPVRMSCVFGVSRCLSRLGHSRPFLPWNDQTIPERKSRIECAGPRHVALGPVGKPVDGIGGRSLNIVHCLVSSSGLAMISVARYTDESAITAARNVISPYATLRDALQRAEPKAKCTLAFQAEGRIGFQ